MAFKKFDNSERPKRSYTPRGEGASDKKAFISKFKRKSAGTSGEEKPSSSSKEERPAPLASERKFISRAREETKPIYPSKPGPGSFSRNIDKPRYGNRKEVGTPTSPARKRLDSRPDEGKRAGFTKGPRKDFDRSSDKKRERPTSFQAGKSFDKPTGAKNRAFSSPKKYFKRKDDGLGSEGTEKTRGFDKDRPRPITPRATRSFTTPSYSKPRKFSGAKKRDVMTEKPKDGLIRLNKYISNSGVCSRREADELIKMGLISVNGQVITEMGHKVKPTDDVRHESKRLSAEKNVYILLNKPKGFITTTEDPQERKTVMGLIGNAVKERIYPVGRLDRNTTGLLLLTNDGDLADKLTHPSYNAKKIYKVELDKPLTKADFQKILDGIHLEEGKAVVDDLAFVDDDNKSIGLEIHIGWNRIVRRIFEFLGYEVVRLDRVVYAGLDKKNLGRGEWRYLKQEEVIKLKHLNKG